MTETIQHPRFGEITTQAPVITPGEQKEYARWNAPKRQGGHNADGFEPYPRMLYKAQQHPLSGKHEVMLTRDVLSPDRTVVILNAEEFNRTCQVTVKNEQEYNAARGDGWRDTPKEAMAYHNSLQDDIARAAAERHASDLKMGEKARAEAEMVDASTAEQVPEITKDRMAAARAAKAAKRDAQQGA